MALPKYGTVLGLLIWCRTYPEKKAALITPEGTYVVMFTLTTAKGMKDGDAPEVVSERTNNYKWLKKYFLKD